MSTTAAELTGGLDVDAPGITGRIGGPLGRHVRIGGFWFDPVPFTFGAGIVSWLVLMARQVPCLTSDPTFPLNRYARLCYSDISVLFQARESWWTGGALYTGDEPLEYPVLTGALIWFGRKVAGLLGAEISDTADATQRLHAANVFFSVTAVMLFACFMALVWAHLQMGKDQPALASGVRLRAWDAILVALSPLVMAAGLINWDMAAVALTSLTLLAWARRKPALAGVLLGLACATKFYPLALLPVYLLLCLRTGREGMRAFAKLAGAAAGTWALVNGAFLLLSTQVLAGADVPFFSAANWSAGWEGWKYFYALNVDRTADLGSLWYVLSLAGLEIPHVSVFMTAFIALGGCAVIWLAFTAPRRPRVAQLLLVVMVIFLAFNKVYSPQYVLWLLPIAVLARPKLFDMIVLTCSELLYYFAIWGFLEGELGIGTGADRLYWISVVLRIGVQAWFAVRVVDDIRRPWLDPVRQPLVDDPLGGVLDHAVDWQFFAVADADGAAARPARRSADAAEPDDPELTAALFAEDDETDDVTPSPTRNEPPQEDDPQPAPPAESPPETSPDESPGEGEAEER